MRVFAANRRELWVSIALMLALLVWPSMPIRFVDALVIAAVMVAGLLCAINAMLDLDNMGIVETYLAGLWLVAMLIVTPWTLYALATIQQFSNR